MHRQCGTSQDRSPSGRRVLLGGVLLAGLPAVLIVLLGVGLAAYVDRPLADLTRDVHATARQPVYVGVLSAITVMAWTAAATLGLFAGLLGARRSLLARPAALLGLLSLAFALDDELQVHDSLAQRVSLGEEVVFAAYGLCLLLVLAVDGRRLVRAVAAPLLAVAVLVLGLSVAVDVLVSAEAGTTADGLRIGLEDGGKLVGAALWAAALAALGREVVDRPAPADAEADD